MKSDIIFIVRKIRYFGKVMDIQVKYTNLQIYLIYVRQNKKNTCRFKRSEYHTVESVKIKKFYYV